MQNLLLLFALASLLLACSSEPPVRAEKPPEEAVEGGPARKALLSGPAYEIVVAGGALSARQGGDPGQAYAALLEERLRKQGHNIRILNASISHETAGGLLERLPFLLEQPISVFILELGAGDEEKGTAPQAFARDIRRILNRTHSRHPAAHILLMPSASKPSLNAPLQQLAEEENWVACLPLPTSIGQPTDSLLHQKLAKEVWPPYPAFFLNEQGESAVLLALPPEK